MITSAFFFTDLNRPNCACCISTKSNDVNHKEFNFIEPFSKCSYWKKKTTFWIIFTLTLTLADIPGQRSCIKYFQIQHQPGWLIVPNFKPFVSEAFICSIYKIFIFLWLLPYFRWCLQKAFKGKLILRLDLLGTLAAINLLTKTNELHPSQKK